MSKYQAQIDQFMETLKERSSHEPEFLQAVEEVVEVVLPIVEETPKYKKIGRAHV